MRERATKLRFVGSSTHHHDALALLSQAGDIAAVSRGCERSLVMLCPDNCGDAITINLDERAGPAWKRYGGYASLTVYPSIWRESGCRAHFVIWRGSIDWLDSFWWMPSDELLAAVGEALSEDYYRSFVDVATQLDELPWDVASACRALVHRGFAEEGRGASRGTFRKTGRSSPRSFF